ncbi:MAG TPA: hypothetical protein VFT91_04680, partial [Dehalococcoidia bacterium]|nr:hypothetical protein [Dehalococcoidia bacterium]
MRSEFSEASSPAMDATAFTTEEAAPRPLDRHGERQPSGGPLSTLRRLTPFIGAVAPPAVMTLLIAFFHWGLLAGVGVIPYDATTDFYPLARLAAEQARHGHFFDVWNPWVVGGAPQLAASAFHYDPLYWAAAAVPGEFSEHRFDVVVVAHLMFGALGIYLLARSMSISAWGAALAGLVFALGGRATSLLQHAGSVPDVMSWLAWSALLLRLAILSRVGLPFAVAAAVSTMFGLNRLPAQVPNFTLAVAAVGAALPVVTQRSLLPRAAGYGAIWLAMSLALLAGSIAVMGAIGTESTSGVIKIWRGELDAVPPQALVTTIIPGALGNTSMGAWAGIGDPTETWLYWGLLTLLLAAYKLVRSTSPETVWLALVALTGLTLATGMATPVYSFLFVVAPPVRYLLRAEPYMVLYALAIALLAGGGAAALAEDLQRQASLRRWTAAGVALLAALFMAAGLATALSARSALGRLWSEDTAFAALLLFGLAAAVATYTRSWRSRHVFMVVLLLAVFADLWHAGAFRHFSFGSGSGEATVDSLSGDKEAVAALRQLSAGMAPYEFRIEPVAAGAGWENGSIVAGFQTMGGAISVNPERLNLVLGKRDHRIATGLPVFSGAVRSYSSPLFSLFNVRYIVSPTDMTAVDPGFQDGEFSLVYGGFRKIYEDKSALPRVRLTGAVPAADMDQALRLLTEGSLDLRTETIVEGAPAAIPPPPSGAQAQATIESYEMSRVRFRVQTAQEAVLVLADNYAPGWKASIDGRAAPVLAANVVHRAVIVPPGRHVVE